MPGFSVKEGKPSNLQGLALGGAHGLLSGLQSFAADRLAQMRAQNEQRKLQDTFRALNLSPQEQSDILHLLPPEQRLSGLQALAGLQPQQQAVQQQPKTLEQEPTLLAAAQEQRAQELRPEQSQVTPTQNEPPKMSDVIAEIKKMGLGVPNKIQRNQLENIIKDFNPANAPVPVQQPQEPAAMAPQTSAPVAQAVPSAQPQTPVSTAIDQTQSRFAKPLTESDKIAREKLDFAQSKDRREYKTVLNEKGRRLKDSLHQLEQMDELNRSGKLSGEAWTVFLENSGIDIPSLLGPESEAYQKLAIGRLGSTLKDTFGSRPTQWDAQTQLKTIPGLLNSPEGRNRLITMKKYQERADLAKVEAEQEILKTTRNIPEDISEMADERASKKIDGFYKKWREELVKPVPKGSSKAAIVAGALGGKAVGGITKSLPKILSKAAGTGANLLGSGLLG